MEARAMAYAKLGGIKATHERQYCWFDKLVKLEFVLKGAEADG